MTPRDERFAAARRLVAKAKTQPLPAHVADQLGAAGNEAHTFARRLERTLATVAPGERWRSHHGAGAVPDEVAALVLVALAGLRACAHLLRGGPQPAWARLALHRLDCRRCLATLRRPPDGEGDRCDWCGGRGHEVFRAFAVQQGPVVVIGDAGRCCADTLAWFERGVSR